MLIMLSMLICHSGYELIFFSFLDKMFLVHLKDQRFLLKIYLLLNYNRVKSDLKNKSAYNILFQQLREPKDALLGSRAVQTARGGVLPEILGGGVRPASGPKPLPRLFMTKICDMP